MLLVYLDVVFFFHICVINVEFFAHDHRATPVDFVEEVPDFFIHTSIVFIEDKVFLKNLLLRKISLGAFQITSLH